MAKLQKIFYMLAAKDDYFVDLRRGSSVRVGVRIIWYQHL